MNVEQIIVSSAEAAAKAEAHAANPKADSADFYAACRQAYEAIAEGGTIIHLSRAFQLAGLDDSGRPRLAIARADRKQVHFRWWNSDTIARFDTNVSPGWGQSWDTLIERVDMGQTFERGENHIGMERSGYALVPAVPADVRPKVGQLKEWYVLWEVEQWFERSQIPEPPHDPLLLRKIRGELFQVLAEWDLTEIERAVMSELALEQ